MELKVEEYQLPSNVVFNYEELKAELIEKVSHYESLVYTDDQVKEAKADKANLNKLKKALNDERIRREKEYLAPFNVFKAQVNEIIGIIDKPIAVIDSQVSAFEEKRKSEKLAKIVCYFDNIASKAEWIKYEQIHDDRWLNASVNEKAVYEQITAKLAEIDNNVMLISNMAEYSFEALEVYKATLDVQRAFAEGKRMAEIAKRKAEQEEARKKAEAEKLSVAMNLPFEDDATPPAPPERMWVKFQAYLTVEQAIELKHFFICHGIEFKGV